MIRRLRKRISEFIEQARQLEGRELLMRARKFPRYSLRILRHTYRLFMDNRGQYQANTLAYRTMVSLAPVLAFMLSFSLFMGFDITAKLRDLLSTYMVTDERIVEEVFAVVNRFQEQAKQATVIGFLVLLLGSIFLINAIENTINNIWCVTRRRPYVWRVLSYTAMTVLLPVLLGLSIYMTAQLQVQSVETALGENLATGLIPIISWTWSQFSEMLLPLSMVWLLFFSMFKWLPNTRVETRAALTSSLLVAMAFEVCKWGFSIFATRMLLSRQLWWGSLGVFLVFLMWVYIIWWIALFGAQMSYVIQNYRFVFSKGLPLEGRIGEAYLAARTMLEVAKRHFRGETGPSVRELAESLAVDVPRIQKLLDRLIQAELLIMGTVSAKTGSEKEVFVPARDLGTITLAEVIRNSTDFWEMQPDEKLLELEEEGFLATGPSRRIEEPERALDQLILDSRSQLEATLDISFRDLLSKPAATQRPENNKEI